MTSAFTEPPDTSVITIRRASGTIVVRPAPRREPPFDDELVGDPSPVAAYDRQLPFDRPRGRRLVQPVAPSSMRAALPDPGHWARRLLIGVIETAGGRRPLNQLTTLLSPAVANGLRTDFELAAQRGRPHWTHAATVRSVRASEPAENVAELSATVRAGERVHAVAMRLEVRHGRWCCTRLVLG
jgi:Family of unknown function (DUF6459)